eukprot:TRINITY_DN2698_c0_g2_i1.p1 TRINITY_DN2698_c0_g2~~TRINITY_DN2698_c0_g2_i1.p1  ORF type:complete len:265 (+),score=76.78 TRINITY_DN2698_c0_g2_i1:247-1041(+)
MSEKQLPSNLTRSELLALLQQQETLLANPIVKRLPDGGAKIINKIAQIKQALNNKEKDVLVDGIHKMNIVDNDVRMSDNTNPNHNHNHHANTNTPTQKGKEPTTSTLPAASPNKPQKENKVKVIDIKESVQLEQYWKRKEIENQHKMVDTNNKADWEESQEEPEEGEEGEGEEYEVQDLDHNEAPENDNEFFWEANEEAEGFDLFDQAYSGANAANGLFRTQPPIPQVAQNLKIVERSGEWDFGEMEEGLTADIVIPEEFKKKS